MGVDRYLLVFVKISGEDRGWWVLIGIAGCLYRLVVKIGIGGC